MTPASARASVWKKLNRERYNAYMKSYMRERRNEWNEAKSAKAAEEDGDSDEGDDKQSFSGRDEG